MTILRDHAENEMQGVPLLDGITPIISWVSRCHTCQYPRIIGLSPQPYDIKSRTEYDIICYHVMCTSYLRYLGISVSTYLLGELA